jgi:hypothetical protein
MAKNTKQSKQKKSVLNKLGGLSKRSKFIVVVLIFAVLGGGYLTYKSFAATATVAPIQTFAEAMLVNGNPNKCTSNKVQDPAKNNLVVLNIYCPPKNKFVAYNAYSQDKVFWPQGTYQNCVIAKGVGKFRISQGGNTDYKGLGSKDYSINDSTYREYCSYTIQIASGGQVFDKRDSGDIRSMAVGNVGLDGSATLMTIRSMTKYWYAPVAGAPSGGK